MNKKKEYLNFLKEGLKLFKDSDYQRSVYLENRKIKSMLKDLETDLDNPNDLFKSYKLELKKILEKQQKEFEKMPSITHGLIYLDKLVNNDVKKLTSDYLNIVKNSDILDLFIRIAPYNKDNERGYINVIQDLVNSGITIEKINSRTTEIILNIKSSDYETIIKKIDEYDNSDIELSNKLKHRVYFVLPMVSEDMNPKKTQELFDLNNSSKDGFITFNNLGLGSLEILNTNGNTIREQLKFFFEDLFNKSIHTRDKSIFISRQFVNNSQKDINGKDKTIHSEIKILESQVSKMKPVF